MCQILLSKFLFFINKTVIRLSIRQSLLSDINADYAVALTVHLYILLIFL